MAADKIAIKSVEQINMERAVMILGAIADEDAASLTDLSRRLGIHRATLHRELAKLRDQCGVAVEYVYATPTRKRPKVVRWGVLNEWEVRSRYLQRMAET